MTPRRHPGDQEESEATMGQELDVSAVEKILHTLEELKAKVDLLIRERTVKEWYTVEEVAAVLKKAPYTVREYCRLGRLVARKKECGRGEHGEWLVSHEELARALAEGLRPPPYGFRP